MRKDATKGNNILRMLPPPTPLSRCGDSSVSEAPFAPSNPISVLPDDERAVHRAYDETVLGWARVLELRSAEVEGHSVRVGALAIDLAVRLGIPQSEHRAIWRGAILHDVGKMAIPDEILLKPGPLDDAERRVMETHPLLAREMLEPIHFLRPSLSIPLYHHERWDGRGYPVGLAGEDIPLDARLFSVVDVYDALTSNRPYRAAWDRQTACQYVAEGSSTQFDPQVVEVFLQLMTESE